MNERVSRSQTGVSWGSWIACLIALAIAVLLFRPILWNDLRALFGPESADASRQQALFNAGADLLCFILVAACLIGLVATRIGSIAVNTFREAVRNRILYFILFFALILMGASVVVRQLVIMDQERFIVHLGLSSISFFGLMVAIFVGISLVYNELERKTIYTIVSKPIHRYQFLLGKYFGLLLTIYVIVAVMTLFFFFLVNYQNLASVEAIDRVLWKENPDGTFAMVEGAGWVKTIFLIKAASASFFYGMGSLLGFPHGPVTENIMIVIAMYCLELMIVTAFAVLYSSFSTPTLSAVFTVLTFLAGRLNEDIMRLAELMAKKSLESQGVVFVSDLTLAAQIKIRLAEFAALVVPNLDSLNVTAKVLYEQTMEVWRYPILYSICYTGFVLLLSIAIFRKRNFK